MPAISFQEMWLNMLLSGEKMQTTRKQTDRFAVGDVGYIYIEQRRRILDKPLRRMTHAGVDAMHERGYPMIPEFHRALYHAHFLGKVEVAYVHDVCMSWHPARGAWAVSDGFENFAGADTWFSNQYGAGWQDETWTVIGWDGWLERYFEPGAVVT